jgi:hypothetical protein
MSISSKAALSAALAAMVITTPLPAFAAVGTGDVAMKNSSAMVEQSSEYHRRRWRHRDRVDGGDILTGIGILAGIAILADAASSSSKRDRNNRRYDDRPRDYDRQSAPDFRGGNDVGTAVSACTDAAERSANGRVDEIRSVTRNGNSWQVDGTIGDDSFVCSASDGRVDSIRINDRAI